MAEMVRVGEGGADAVLAGNAACERAERLDPVDEHVLVAADALRTLFVLAALGRG